MITIARGNLLEMDVEALVNSVNCVGYMGKGIALQFKKAFPDNFKAYQKACRAELVQPGKMFVFETGHTVNPKYIINFPTKRHWRGKSRYEDIESGLKDLIEKIRKRRIGSIAIPPLGSGLGGLDWRKVKPMIQEALGAVPEVNILLFEPTGAPDARDMPVRTPRPRMTDAKAILIKLMQQYSQLAYRLSLLEIQKLAYFIQEDGEVMRLNYQTYRYGPYAPNLNKVLEAMEGHYTRGYGDTQRPDVEIELLAKAKDEADKHLTKNKQILERLERVGNLIEGFETPYGMELLSSVHWVASHSDTPVTSADEAIGAIQRWDERKRKLFKEDHIRIAWDRLVEENWVLQAK